MPSFLHRYREGAVIGLGLMGHSITACLLAAGHRVTGIGLNLDERKTSKYVLSLLRQMRREGLLQADPHVLMANLSLSEDYRKLRRCSIAIESITENLEVKRDAYRLMEEVLRPSAIIGTNTSAIPVSLLQNGAKHPGRFVGIHWDEPAHVTRFMEVIAGEKTNARYTGRVMRLAQVWGKEPSLVRRDVPGFITNRVSYAMFREACHLVDSGVATVEDVDRSLRNDVGWWMPFAGPFRYMDLMGVQSYIRVMKQLAPELSNDSKLPRLMQKIEAAKGHGSANGHGFYKYTPEESLRWEKLFLNFNYEIRKLALKYPQDAAKQKKSR